MDKPINWIDHPFKSKERLVFTNEQLQIPGVRSLGRHNIQSAVPALTSHYHKDALEITYVTKGTLELYVNESEYHVNAGEAFIAFPNEVHSTNGIPMSLGEIYWLQLDFHDVDRFLYLDPEAANNIIQKLKAINHHQIYTDNKEIQKLMVKIFELIHDKTNRYLIANYLTLYLYLLISFSNNEHRPIAADIDQSLTFIHSHITDTITLDYLAGLCQLSTSQYKQKFKSQLGTSPRNYINKYKIAYAKKALSELRSITDIAIDLGFSTSSYFSIVFKRYTSYTPTEYRDKVLKLKN